MNNENKQLKNIKLNEKEMAFLKLVCVSNNLTYPTTNDELISALESKIPIGVSMVVLKQYYEQEIVRMQILLRAYKVFDRQQKGKALMKADFEKRHGITVKCFVCNEMVHRNEVISEYTLEHSYVTGEAGYYDHRCKSHKLVGHTYKNEKDGRKKSIIILCNMCEEVINGAAGEDYFNYDDSEDGLLVFCRSCDWEYNAPPSL